MREQHNNIIQRAQQVLNDIAAVIKKAEYYKSLSSPDYNLVDKVDIVLLNRIQRKLNSTYIPHCSEKHLTNKEILKLKSTLKVFEAEVKKQVEQLTQSFLRANGDETPNKLSMLQQAFAAQLKEARAFIQIPEIEKKWQCDTALQESAGIIQQIAGQVANLAMLDQSITTQDAHYYTTQIACVKEQLYQFGCASNQVAERIYRLEASANAYQTEVDSICAFQQSVESLLKRVRRHTSNYTLSDEQQALMHRPSKLTTKGDLYKLTQETTTTYSTQLDSLRALSNELKAIERSLENVFQKRLKDQEETFERQTKNYLDGVIDTESQLNLERLNPLSEKFKAAKNANKLPEQIIAELEAINQELAMIYHQEQSGRVEIVHRVIAGIAEEIQKTYQEIQTYFNELKYNLMEEDKLRIIDFLEEFKDLETGRECKTLKDSREEFHRLKAIQKKQAPVAKKILQIKENYERVNKLTGQSRLNHKLPQFLQKTTDENAQHLLALLLIKHKQRDGRLSLTTAIKKSLLKLPTESLELCVETLQKLPEDNDARTTIRAIKYLQGMSKDTLDRRQALGDFHKEKAIYTLLSHGINFKTIDLFLQQGSLYYHLSQESPEHQATNACLIGLTKLSEQRPDLLKIAKIVIDDLCISDPFLLIAVAENKELQAILLREQNQNENIKILKTLLVMPETMSDENRTYTKQTVSYYFSSCETTKAKALKTVDFYYQNQNRHAIIALLKAANETPQFDLKNRASIISKLFKYLSDYTCKDIKSRCELDNYFYKATTSLLEKGDLQSKKDQLISLANSTIHHRQLGRRIAADIIQFITGLFVLIIPMRLITGQSALFSTAKTRRLRYVSEHIDEITPGRSARAA